MVSPRTDTLDCIRCGKPLTPESLTLIHSLPCVDPDRRSVWHYRHKCRWEYYSAELVQKEGPD